LEHKSRITTAINRQHKTLSPPNIS